MTVSIVAGRDVIKTDREEVIDLLRSTLARVESGELTPNRILMALVDADVGSLALSVIYHGRAVEMLGHLALVEDSIKEDIYE